jgi:hypothetical protein
MILERYCDGIYGCEEHDVVRYGLFQHALIKSMVALSQTPESFLRLMSLNYFARFFNVVEESCVFAFHLALNKELASDAQLYTFIEYSLSICELAINPAFYKYLHGFLDGLYKIEQRILSFTVPNIPEMPGPSDPDILLVISPELHRFLEKARSLSTKLEALTEY